ncbi:hypothetical protein IMZ48_36325 [Candidatus Bathyarchaeota archaeon]|nr:hypothetical protein [Candidatus Bathyarchaeota archaeon]
MARREDSAPRGEILDSWKQIAQYLHREVRTCYRWARKLGLPVHRIDDKSPKSKVFAYKDEIDKWLKEKTRYQALPKNGVHTKRRLIYGGLSFVAVLSIVAIAKWPSISPSSGIVSIAVAPLKSLDPSGNDDYLSEELARLIADNLPVPNKLRVIPAYKIHQFPAEIADVKKLGNELDVDYILRGEVKKGNPTIQVSVELVRTNGGSIIWASPFLAPVEKALTIPPSICAAIHKVLKISSGTLARNGIYTKDYRALDSYLKGDFILGRLNSGSDDPWQLYHQGEYYAGRFTPEANELAIKLFSQAREIDPTFALAYIGLASCYANYVNFNWQFDISWLNKAEELLAKAQAFAPDLPEYYAALIAVKILKEVSFSEDVWTSVEELVAEGVKRCGSYPRLNSIIGYFFYKKFGREGDIGDFQMAREYKERSFWLDPYDIGNIIYADILLLDKEFAKALEVCDFLEKVDETRISKFLRGEIYYYMGDFDRSRSVFEQLMDDSLEYKIGVLYYLAMISAGKGEASKAKKNIEEIEYLSPDEFVYFEKELKLASIWAGLGEKVLASKILEAFLNNPRNQKDLYLSKKYIELDNNFLQMKQDNVFKKIFNFKGETNGKKQDN